MKLNNEIFTPLFDEMIGNKFKKIFKKNDNFTSDEIEIIKNEILPNLSKFLLENLVLNINDFKKLYTEISNETSKKIIDILRNGEDFDKINKKITRETSKKALEIITDGNKIQTNFKVLKYLGDDGILNDEKSSSYMNNFSGYLIDYNEFYEILPKDIKENLIEKFFRFIEKQEKFKKQKSFEKIDSIEKYYYFLGSKINFPKVGIKLILDYFSKNGFIELEFNESKKIFDIKLTQKGEKSYLGLNEILNIPNEYIKIEGELKERIVKMIHKNLLEGKAKLDQIKDDLFEEGVMIHKKDLKDLLGEILQTMASRQNSKSVMQKLNEEIEEVENYDVFGGIYQFKRKETDSKTGEKIEKIYSIPVSEVDSIFKAYSVYGENLTQQKVMYGFKIKKEVWSLLKSRLSLTKQSLPVSPYTLESFDEKDLSGFNDKLGDELIRDKFRKSLVDTQEKLEKKEFNRMKKILSGLDDFLEHLEDYIKGYKPRNFGFKKNVENNVDYRKDEYVSISFGDIHLGKNNTNEVINRMRKMFLIALKAPQKNICLIGLGDFFESIVEGGMHPGQIESMDGPYGFDIIMVFVNLIEEIIVNLSYAGKEVTFYSIGGNHDRLGKGHSEDIKRTANLIVVEMIKRSLRNIDVKIEALKEKTNSFVYGNFNYIINHGDDGFSKKVQTKPEDVLWKYGDQKRHNIIKFGHEHHGYLGETKDATIIGTAALAGKGEYDTRLGLFSESSITIIEENEEFLPDVYFKRLK